MDEITIKNLGEAYVKGWNDCTDLANGYFKQMDKVSRKEKIGGFVTGTAISCTALFCMLCVTSVKSMMDESEKLKSKETKED